MIKPREKARIIKTLGKHYSKKIIAELNKQKIFNADGKEFSSESIRRIVCGLNENIDVEIAVLKFTKKIATRQQQTIAKRKLLIKK